MKIAVVIPAKTKTLLDDLLDCIAFNDVKPAMINIINGIDPIQVNGKTYIWRIHAGERSPLPVQVDTINLSTNHAWTHGIRHVGKDIDAVAIFNDDILIDRHFFAAICAAMQRHKGTGIFMATPAPSPDYVYAANELEEMPPTRCFITKAMHGYCFVVRKNVLDNMPPIPPEVRTWYGDNWIWVHNRRQGYNAAVVRGTYVYHYGGRAIEREIAKVGRRAIVAARDADERAYRAAIAQYTT